MQARPSARRCSWRRSRANTGAAGAAAAEKNPLPRLRTPRPLPMDEKTASTKAFIGLGANLGDPEAQVRRAFAALAELPGTRLLAASSLYRSAPVGVVGQLDFINAVAEVETALAARALLETLLAEERRFGRRREFPNAPRTLDLDLLLYEIGR